MKSIDLSLIATNHTINQSLIVQSWWRKTKNKPAKHILGRELWLLMLLWWHKTCFMKYMPQLCWCSLPHSSAHSKHSSHLHHHAVDRRWWMLHMLIFEILSMGDAYGASSSWRLHTRNALSTNPRACRLRDTQQFWHFTCATPMLQHGYSIQPLLL